MVHKWYILPIGGLYATYHLLGEPETTIEGVRHPSRTLVPQFDLYGFIHGLSPAKVCNRTKRFTSDDSLRCTLLLGNVAVNSVLPTSFTSGNSRGAEAKKK